MVAVREGGDKGVAMQNGVEEDAPDFSDPSDFEDDYDEEELLADVIKEEPKESEAVECCVIVDGIPVVGSDRLPKLKKVLAGIFNKFSDKFVEHYPLDDAGNTKGFVFIEFANKSAAKEAAEMLNGYALDKVHRFKTNLFSELDRYETVDQNWTEPKARPYQDLGNLTWWLDNPACQDQFSLQYEGGDRVAIFWNSYPEPLPINEKSSNRQRWTEAVVRWSPRGSFMATFHQQGIALWAGQQMRQVRKFSVRCCAFLEFSPCEKYLVTYAAPQPGRAARGAVEPLTVWDVRTGEPRRRFTPLTPIQVNAWPYFKWSFDDRYFACIKDARDGTGTGISVYDTQEDCVLLGKKSIRLDGVRDFAWSPKAAVLAYWLAEQAQTPARVAVMSVPQKEEMRSQNLFNVANVTLHWQASGDHLAVKAELYKKKKEKKDEKALDDGGEGTTFTHLHHSLEVFRMVEKPISVYKLQLTELIVSFCWEPHGSRFCVLVGSPLKAIAQFYLISENKPVLLKTLADLPLSLNTASWAPQGSAIAIVGLRTSNGNLIFVDAGGATIERTITGDQSHPAVCDTLWDPTGRYLSTVSHVWGEQKSSDYGYRIWTAQGRQLCARNVDRLCEFTWRPRPPTSLSDAKIKEIRRNLKNFSAKFEADDSRDKGQASQEVIERRQQLMREFDDVRRAGRERFAAERAARTSSRGGVDTEADDGDQGQMEEETIEVPLVTEHTIIEKNTDE